MQVEDMTSEQFNDYVIQKGPFKVTIDGVPEEQFDMSINTYSRSPSILYTDAQGQKKTAHYQIAINEVYRAVLIPNLKGADALDAIKVQIPDENDMTTEWSLLELQKLFETSSSKTGNTATTGTTTTTTTTTTTSAPKKTVAFDANTKEPEEEKNEPKAKTPEKRKPFDLSLKGQESAQKKGKTDTQPSKEPSTPKTPTKPQEETTKESSTTKNPKVTKTKPSVLTQTSPEDKPKEDKETKPKEQDKQEKQKPSRDDTEKFFGHMGLEVLKSFTRVFGVKPEKSLPFLLECHELSAKFQ